MDGQNAVIPLLGFHLRLNLFGSSEKSLQYLWYHQVAIVCKLSFPSQGSDYRMLLCTGAVKCILLNLLRQHLEIWVTSEERCCGEKQSQPLFCSGGAEINRHGNTHLPEVAQHPTEVPESSGNLVLSKAWTRHKKGLYSPNTFLLLSLSLSSGFGND